ncbi:response regulator transcription factor [Natronospirillum operosum]|uniref:Response regulator transcription factor n=1 Tax=Natronospirillum operosum TaxID=2759953 RepID=A0A4Z0W7I5_9GAMM|nr:response regulator transcription factor [Natronospirillum operosum]TGG90662.1 response regulator transcription factor [Natronospirillum operosum]
MNLDKPCGQLLLVEDDRRLARLTAAYLEREGYAVEQLADGDAAAVRIPEAQPDLVILDIMLPGLDGLEVCRQVRHQYQGPIIMLTARDQVMDEVLGLEVGADDYLTKPVQPERLLARIRAHLRRAREFAGTSRPDSSAAVSDAPPGRQPIETVVQVHEQDREIWCQGRRLLLHRPEYDLLALLLSRPGHLFSRDELSLALRGVAYDGASRHIDILVSGVRQAIGQPAVIKTVRSRGYQLVRHWPENNRSG